VALVAGLAVAFARLPAGRRAWGLGVVLLVGLLLALKWEPLGRVASAGLRMGAGQPADLAAAGDLRWLGFSYLASTLPI